MLVPAWKLPDLNQTLKSLTKLSGGRSPCEPAARALGRGPGEEDEQTQPRVTGNLSGTSLVEPPNLHHQGLLL